jgi:hypothetical protein
MKSTRLEVRVNPLVVAQEVSNAVEISSPARNHQSNIRTGPLVVDLETRVVTADGKPVRLTGREYSILELLSLRQGVTVTKEMLLDHLYGRKDEPELKIIDVFVCHLRRSWRRRCAANTISRPFGVGAIGSAIRRETVMHFPGTVTRLIMRFDLPSVPFTVPASPRTGGNEYVWHCHILETRRTRYDAAASGLVGQSVTGSSSREPRGNTRGAPTIWITYPSKKLRPEIGAEVTSREIAGVRTNPALNLAVTLSAELPGARVQALLTPVHRVDQRSVVITRLCFHDFWFQAGNKCNDFAALQLRHSKRVERDR